jgi:hypothetical protein
MDMNVKVDIVRSTPNGRVKALSSMTPLLMEPNLQWVYWASGRTGDTSIEFGFFGAKAWV